MREIEKNRFRRALAHTRDEMKKSIFHERKQRHLPVFEKREKNID